MKVLLVDNFDSFTGNIRHYLQICGADVMMLRNNENVMDVIKENKPAGIVFSPGPMRPENHPVMFEILEKYHKSVPILGICLGHQAIGEFFGADLVKAPVPMHGKTSEILHSGHEMYHGIPENFTVARYHSLILSGKEQTDLIITATTKNGIPMSIAHRHLPVWGVQYHPEAIQTEHGIQLLKNWLALFFSKDVF